MAKRKRPYSVGYKKPPNVTRFQAGQSGNPQGRPKGSKNLAGSIRRELDKKVSVTENGRRKNISKRDIAAKQIVHKAISGDVRSIPQLLKIDASAEAGDGATQAAPIDANDELTMADIIRRIRAADFPSPPDPVDANHKQPPEPMPPVADGAPLPPYLQDL